MKITTEVVKLDIAYKGVLFEIIVNNINLGVAIVDKNGFFICYNDVMGEIEGLDKQKVLGKHISDVYSSFHDKNSTLYNCLNVGTPIFNELQSYTNGNGRKVFSIVTTVPIKFGDKIAGAMEIAKNIDKVDKASKSADNWINKCNNRSINNDITKTNYYGFDDFITCDKYILDLIDKVKRMARFESNVLICGETGTGKEIFAQSIHNISSRKHKPFIAQNCAAIPENLLESILFGTEKGSFTGATDKEGLFEQADGGTLLLDELNSLPLHLQTKLLRVLQEKYIRRVGGNIEKRVDVRVIATVNEEPLKLIETGRLRQDLFFRLSTLYIYIPPLRNRKDDIFLLIEQYIKRYSILFGIRPVELSKKVSNFFYDYEWSGNVRELINVIEYILMNVDEDERIQLKHLPYYLLEKLERNNMNSGFKKKYINNSYHDMLDEFERKIILEELIRCKWNVTKTAEMLNIKRQTLQNKIKRLKIDDMSNTMDFSIEN